MAISETSAALLAVLPLFFFVFWLWMSKWRWRNHVWADIELQEGKVVRKRFRPDKHGLLQTVWGTYATEPHAFSLVRDRPMFRYKQGSPFPIRYDILRQLDKKGVLIELMNPFPVVIPAETLSTFLKQHLFQDAYASRFGMILVLLIAIGFVGILVAGLYLRGG